MVAPSGEGGATAVAICGVTLQCLLCLGIRKNKEQKKSFFFFCGLEQAPRYYNAHCSILDNNDSTATKK